MKKTKWAKPRKTFSLRAKREVHQKIERLSTKLQISKNQVCINAIEALSTTVLGPQA